MLARSDAFLTVFQQIRKKEEPDLLPSAVLFYTEYYM